MVTVNVVLLATILLTPVLASVTDSGASSESKADAAKAPWNITETDSLKRSLLVGYDKFARPSHHNHVTNVSLGLSIYHVDLDDLTGVMTVHGWVKLGWNDDKLIWNSSEYGGLSYLHVADHEIWQPDIMQYNSASGNTVDQLGNTHCIVFENGSVIWVPPAKLTAFCGMDLKHWPQDEQICTFTFGSWTYDGSQIDIETGGLFDLDFNNDFYIDGGEWELVTASQERFEKTYECCEDSPYVGVNYEIHVRRLGGGSTRGTLLRTPAIVAVLFSLLSHCLPPTSPRLPLSVVSPSLLSIGLLYFAHRLPPSKSTPNIVMYYCISLYVACLSGVVTVAVINMSLSRRTLPWALRRILCSQIAKCLRLPQLVEPVEHFNAEELQNTIGGNNGIANTEEGVRILSESPTPARDWLILATAIDRITFIILFLIFVSILICFC